MEEIVKPLRGYSLEPIYYVYLHKRPELGTVFYVGKGHGNRAWIKTSRNKHWNNVVEKYGGFEVEIIKGGLTEQEAFVLEAEIISKYGLNNLTNQTLGGISTTGFRHSEESRKKMRQNALDNIEANPELYDRLLVQIKKLHYLQTYDDEYKEKMSAIQKEVYAKKSEQEKKIAIEKKTAWLHDPVKKAAAHEKLMQYKASEEYKQKNSKRMKDIWLSMSEEERKRRSEISSMTINDPENRKKLKEAISDKIVVNRSYIFNSKREFLDQTNSSHVVLQKAFTSSKKWGFEFCITHGYFIENYSEEKHVGIPYWDGSEINKLDFDCLPRSKALVMDESKVFLSMTEASLFCKGRSVNATADFITKNMKLNKPAMGHFWRVATPTEVEKEIITRLEKIVE